MGGARQVEPDVGSAVVRFVMAQTAVEWHMRQLVAAWEGKGVATAVAFADLGEVVAYVNKWLVN